MPKLTKKKPYIVAHRESEIGLAFSAGRGLPGYEFITIDPIWRTLIFRRIPLWRRILGERGQ